MFFLKSLLLYSQALIRQSKYVVMMTKEGSTKIVNFMTPGVGVLMLGLGHISHYSEYVLSSTLSIYFTIDIVLKNYDAFFLCHYWFLFSMMGQLICKNEPFWQEVNVKCLILRWPLRPMGLFSCRSLFSGDLEKKKFLVVLSGLSSFP